jgi:hypothetical protein
MDQLITRMPQGIPALIVGQDKDDIGSGRRLCLAVDPANGQNKQQDEHGSMHVSGYFVFGDCLFEKRIGKIPLFEKISSPGLVFGSALEKTRSKDPTL